MKNLQLALKTKWFEMTKSGEKLEDYREITAYWISRLFENANENKGVRTVLSNYLNNPDNAERWNFEHGYFFKFRSFESNIMTLGYPKSTDSERILKYEHAGIEIRTGNPDWGAEPGKVYFVIKHGKCIS